MVYFAREFLGQPKIINVIAVNTRGFAIKASFAIVAGWKSPNPRSDEKGWDILN